MVRFPNKSLSDQKMWSYWPWKVKLGFLWVFKIVLPGLYLVFWPMYICFSTDFQKLNSCQYLRLNAYLLALESGLLVKKCGLQSFANLPEIWKKNFCQKSKSHFGMVMGDDMGLLPCMQCFFDKNSLPGRCNVEISKRFLK